LLAVHRETDVAGKGKGAGVSQDCHDRETWNVVAFDGWVKKTESELPARVARLHEGFEGGEVFVLRNPRLLVEGVVGLTVDLVIQHFHPNIGVVAVEAREHERSLETILVPNHPARPTGGQVMFGLIGQGLLVETCENLLGFLFFPILLRVDEHRGDTRHPHQTVSRDRNHSGSGGGATTTEGDGENSGENEGRSAHAVSLV